MATTRSVTVSWARHTSPMPPRPSNSISRYRPNGVPSTGSPYAATSTVRRRVLDHRGKHIAGEALKLGVVAERGIRWWGGDVGFDNIEGFTNARVALNTIGSWANLATALEVDIKTPVKDMFFEGVRRAENFPVDVERRDNQRWA